MATKHIRDLVIGDKFLLAGSPVTVAEKLKLTQRYNLKIEWASDNVQNWVNLDGRKKVTLIE